jgi:hypothetical protein
MCDVSDYQRSVDPRTYSRAGRMALMIKAAEGMGQAGAALWAERAHRAHATGLRVVHYHYLDHGPQWPAVVASGAAQGRYLAALVAPHFSPGDRLCADLELEGLTAPEAWGILEGWISALEARGHTDLIGYTFRAYMGERPQLKRARLAGWIIADYGLFGQLPSLLDRYVLGKATCLGRQFTDGTNGAGPHTAAGISGPVDCTRLTTAGRKLLEA